jgi:hypothetical protein
VDLNGDGHKDILSGSYSRKTSDMAGLFQVLWGKPGGGFKQPEVLNGLDNEPLIIPIASRSALTQNICTRPTAVDWDADGDLDLVVGNFAGSFYVFEGKGKGSFYAKPKQLKVNGVELKIQGVHSDPFVIDWDKDGDLDIVSGSSGGGVQWSENTAGAGKPVALTKFKNLIAATGSVDHEEQLVGPTRSTRIWIDDVNGDGRWDVFVGDSLTLTSPAKGLTSEQFKQKQVAWDAEYKAALAAYRESKPEDRLEASRKYREVYAKKSAFVTQRRTGFVWLYVQK